MGEDWGFGRVGGTALTCLEYQSTKKQNLFKRCDHKGLDKSRLSQRMGCVWGGGFLGGPDPDEKIDIYFQEGRWRGGEGGDDNLDDR